MIRKDRVDMRKGGLVTFIKDCLTYTEITPPDDMECILVKIKTENSSKLNLVHFSLKI